MPDDAHGYNLRREKLDPMLRELAARTPNVEVRQGVTVDRRRCATRAGRPAGVARPQPSGEEVAVDAKSSSAPTAAADVARLAGVPGRVLPHGRFGYMAYYEGLELQSEPGHSQMWLTGRDVALLLPQRRRDDRSPPCSCTRIGCRSSRPTRRRAFLRPFARWTDAPDLRGATRISSMIGKLDMPNVRRPAGRPGSPSSATPPRPATRCGASVSALRCSRRVAGRRARRAR